MRLKSLYFFTFTQRKAKSKVNVANYEHVYSPEGTGDRQTNRKL